MKASRLNAEDLAVLQLIAAIKEKEKKDTRPEVIPVPALLAGRGLSIKVLEVGDVKRFMTKAVESRRVCRQHSPATQHYSACASCLCADIL